MWIFTLILLSKLKKYIIEQNILIGRGTDEKFISQNYGVFAKAEI